MADNRNHEHSALSQAASAAGTVRSALKTGKVLANAARGAAAGPYGLLAAGIWENRKFVLKITAATAFLLILPILCILMLPSLIFGPNGLDNVPENVLNDNTVITANIAEIERGIESILREKHEAVIKKIEMEAAGLDSDCRYSITDEFADRIIYESILVISQFCASQADYQEIRLDKLEQILRAGTDDIFTYIVNITTEEEIDPDTGESFDISHYNYIVKYAGDSYFSENVFHLTEEQTQTARHFTSNLYLFLHDTIYSVDTNPDLLPGQTGNAAVDLALTMLGTPYSQAFRNQTGYFDCSSFTYWIYNQLGIQLIYDGANTAASQGRFIVENHLAIAYENLAPGDLIFYSFDVNHRYLNIGHVAVYAGDGYVVDASSSKGKVVCRPIYSINHIVLCGRPYAG